MKRLRAYLVIVGLISVGGIGGLAAQDLKTVSTVIGDFSKNLATGISAAATSGLTWSDAYIGQLIDSPPHFGVGAALQLNYLPFQPITSILSALGLALPESLQRFSKAGLPFTTYSVEGRIGGLGAPFDIGVKFGYIPGDIEHFSVYSLDYVMVGFDFRWALIEESLSTPDLSLGIGYTYLKGGLYYDETGPAQLANVPTDASSSTTVAIQDPKVGFEWETHVVELKAQVSKQVAFLTPYAGLGLSLNWALVGPGLYGKFSINGIPLSESQMSYLQSHFPGDNVKAQVEDGSILIKYQQNAALALRAFAGISFDLAFLKADASINYNITARAFGTNFGLRFQL